MRLFSLSLSLPLFLFCLTPALAAPATVPLTPRETVSLVDSLLRAGSGEKARPYCTSQALRLLPLLIETQQRFAEFLDTTRSFDTILEEKSRGEWTAIKMRSVAVFKRPLMGMDKMTSLQAVHLYREEGVWKIADFEELPNEGAALVLRQGSLPSSGTPTKADGRATDFLPVSPRAPVKAVKGEATRYQLRLSMRSGDSLPALLPSAGQRTLERGPKSVWTLVETRLPPLPDSLKKSAAVSPLYLASTPDLDLKDPLLKARAAALKNGSPHAVETARRTYAFVAASFDYKLGASLFGTSREALRALKGDCSEAAVLTAALLRANGIPSRVVMGYATLDRGVFIGHAWAEAWIGGEWIGIDPALKQFPAGAGRLALIRLTGVERMQAIATNLMVWTLANLEIEIVEAWAGNEKLELKEQRDTDKDVRAFLDQVLKGMGN